MNKYDAEHRCPKCDAGGTHDEWKPAHYLGRLLVIEERIERTCANCGYVWHEAPLDTV